MALKIIINDDYTLCTPDGKILGRLWDKDAEKISVVIPSSEINSTCMMIIETVSHKVIDHKNVINGEVSIGRELSENGSVLIGFSFYRQDTSNKNTDFEIFKFDKALNPGATVPITPEQEADLDLLRAAAFVDVDYKEDDDNILEFKNLAGEVVKEIETHGGDEQMQADLAETDQTSPSFVKNKELRYLAEDENHKLVTAEEKQLIGTISQKEDISNKTQTINGSSTQQQYPSAKAVYDAIPQVIDNLNSEDTTKALSANQGRILKSAIDGKPYATSYSNIQAMVTAINAMSNTDLKVAWDLYIKTKNVPDWWVYSVEDTSIPYVYTSDEDFISEVETTGYVQVGYYKIAELETKQIDVSGKEDIINKVSVINEQNKNSTILYPNVKAVYDALSKGNYRIVNHGALPTPEEGLLVYEKGVGELEITATPLASNPMDFYQKALSQQLTSSDIDNLVWMSLIYPELYTGIVLNIGVQSLSDYASELRLKYTYDGIEKTITLPRIAQETWMTTDGSLNIYVGKPDVLGVGFNFPPSQIGVLYLAFNDGIEEGKKLKVSEIRKADNTLIYANLPEPFDIDRFYICDGTNYIPLTQYMEVADGSITTQKLADGAVTYSKLAQTIKNIIDNALLKPVSPTDNVFIYVDAQGEQHYVGLDPTTLEIVDNRLSAGIELVEV